MDRTSVSHLSNPAKANMPYAPKILTVIIPAYNVEDFIADSVHSVIRQSGSAGLLDVIVVVDGATDDTLGKASAAAKGHEHFVRIISQDNGGLSLARNVGLELANTEYVTFLDGDDIWHGNYLETLLPHIAKGTHDIIEYDATRIDSSGNELYLWKIAAAHQNCIRNTSKDEFIDRYRCYSWARVFRAGLVRSKPFPLSRRYEDSATTPWYYWGAKNILSIGTPLIGYRIRSESILASPRKEDVHDISATTREAARMYLETKSPYWQRMTHRSFQQGIGRVVFQPKNAWRELLDISREAIHDVPPPPGAMRWMQVHSIVIYAYLIYIKNKLENIVTAIAPRGLIGLLLKSR